MFSEPSQVPTSLISPPASPRGLPLTIVDAEGAPARSPAFDLSQVAGYLGDFVLDESFNADFLFQSQHSNNKNNTNQHAIATAAATSNEPQMNLEPLGFQFDPAFLDGLDMEMLISEAEAFIQSPDLAALMPSDQVQLEADAELESLLDSIVAQDDSAAVNSPSAEITYPHLAMTPSFVQEETWSSSDMPAATGLATAAFLASVQTDETTSSSFATTYEDDDDSQSIKEPSRGRGRVRSGPGSVSKPYKSKKESNKAAAERYRNKKQNEKKELFAECERHEQRNRELKAEIDEVQAELNFIKNLLVEALLTKQTAAKS